MRLAGAALAGGSPTSHVAILARARGVPLVVGVAGAEVVGEGEPVLLDADEGTLVASPDPATRAGFEARRSGAAAASAAAQAAALMPGRTADGRRVAVLINVDDPGLLDGLSPAICDGIGLVRSEFLFEGGLADEARQLAAYARILDWAGGRPVTIRTLDAGGDKPVPGAEHGGRGQSLPGAARAAAVAGASAGVPGAAAGAGAGGGRGVAEDHGADGDGAGRAGGGAGGISTRQWRSWRPRGWRMPGRPWGSWWRRRQRR